MAASNLSGDVPCYEDHNYTCFDKGLLLPLGNEYMWPIWVSAAVYFIGLLWCFLGVAIITDVFMCAIEKITSHTTKIKVASEEEESGYEEVEVKVWNDTVANLTLMALGSSAPEILLACIETVGNGFKAGELGPGTIVGSAAFNLFCITGFCVIVIPKGEVRRIAAFRVFALTAVFSLFAYIWLAVILLMISPDIVEVWEAILTLAFFPLLVIVAYFVDKNYFSQKRAKSKDEADDDKEQGYFMREKFSLFFHARHFRSFPVIHSKLKPLVQEPDGGLGTNYQTFANGTTSNTDAMRVDSCTWSDQFRNAMNVSGGDIEGASTADYVMHFITFGWKLLFAFVPPPSFFGGWLSFIVSLIVIALLTAVIGDLAAIFGCLVGMRDSITSITFVAMGTSLPDLFASKQAAMMEKTADNSIGNVTGSNSVNVFLGLGLPWVMAAIYWNVRGEVFEVKSGDLGFSVVIFIIAAIVCLALIVARRYMSCFGRAELGGPTCPKLFTGLFLFGLWALYILLSVAQVYGLITAPF